MKKILGYLLPIGLAAVLLYFAYKDMDFAKMGSDLKTAHVWAVLATFGTTILAHWFRALRWNMLFEPVGYKPSSENSFLAVMSGYFANLLIPRAGEVSRCTVLLTSENVPLQTSIGTVLAERGFDLVMLLLIALTAFGLEYDTLSHFLGEQQAKFGNSSSDSPNLKFILLGIGLFFAGILLVFRKPLSRIPLVAKILDFVKGLLEGLLSVTKLNNPGLFLLYTFLIWGGYFMTTYLSLSMFDFTYDLGLKAAFMLLIIGSFGIVVPVPGAVGGPFQLFVSAALAELYMKDPDMSLTAASLMYWSQTFFTILLGGSCYLISVIQAGRKIKDA
jgi:uncharacterized membrane protein YbhN (UPF0104 family)